MNCAQAKKLNLPEILSLLGHEPVSIKKGGIEYWYKSPFRKEEIPSFHTSYLGVNPMWIWNDFSDTGGTVLDFVMRYKGYSSVNQALRFLEDMFGRSKTVGSSSFSFQKQAATFKIDKKNVSSLELLEKSEITNPAILNYLTRERRINSELISKYLTEVRYLNRNNNKEYFAFGMPNISGGLEIRSAMDSYPFKSSLIKKDITIIKGNEARGGVNIFEGMLDFVSLLTLIKNNSFPEDSIILHSLSHLNKAIRIIDNKNYEIINSYLDNNTAGIKATNLLSTAFPNKIDNKSPQFLPHIDINNYLTHMRK